MLVPETVEIDNVYNLKMVNFNSIMNIILLNNLIENVMSYCNNR